MRLAVMVLAVWCFMFNKENFMRTVFLLALALFFTACKAGDGGATFSDATPVYYAQLQPNVCTQLPALSYGLYGHVVPGTRSAEYFIGVDDATAEQNCLNSLHSEGVFAEGQTATFWYEIPSTEYYFVTEADVQAVDAPENVWVYYYAVGH